MESAEYSNLEQVEKEHWYYKGKREAVRYWLRRAGGGARPTLVDFGAGTGLFAREMNADHDVRVVDDHEESLRILRQHFRGDQILHLKDGRVPLPDSSVDQLTALDVLEHVPDDAAVAREFHRLLKPGGVAVITVPAGMSLWSDWDVALHHFRRYSRPQLAAVFPSGSWETIHLNYTNFFAYPAVWLLRRLRKRSPANSRVEDQLPPASVNSLLRQLFVQPAKWPIPLPFGVSLILVARKR